MAIICWTQLQQLSLLLNTYKRNWPQYLVYCKLSFFIGSRYNSSFLFSESLVSFLKYADDVVIDHPYRDTQGLSNMNNALKEVWEWSGQNGLNLNQKNAYNARFPSKETQLLTLI